MKNLILFSFISLLFIGCSDDDGGGDNGTTDTSDYLPSNENATWNYNYTMTNQGVDNTGTFTTTIDGSTSIAGDTYKILDNTFPLVGVMNQVYFKKSESNQITIRPIFNIFNADADLGDLLFIKNSMNEGQLIGEETVEIVSQPTDIPPNEYNVNGTVTPKIYITVKNYHVNKPAEMTFGGTTFSQINHQRLDYEIQVILDIEANIAVGGTAIPFNEEHELVETQEYGNLNIWLAKDIGIVNTEYDYSFEDIEMNTDLTFGVIEIDLLTLAPNISQLNSTLDLQGEATITDYAL